MLAKAKDRQNLGQRLFCALTDLLLIEAAYWVANQRVLIIAEALNTGHGVTWPTKRIRQNGRRLNAFTLEDRPVGHTGRTARPSITDTGDDDIRIVHHLGDDLIRRRFAE